MGVTIRQVVAIATEARLRLRPHHPLGETGRLFTPAKDRSTFEVMPMFRKSNGWQKFENRMSA
ncbi:hypothetical protein J2Y63_006939 [Shinella sp. BE166]|uniref:hypothetical protein n=1 Tax=Shinella sp. BE166 TaxID=3373918 RepID=UPI003EB95679